VLIAIPATEATSVPKFAWPHPSGNKGDTHGYPSTVNKVLIALRLMSAAWRFKLAEQLFYSLSLAARH